jgi:hypothetical protein
MQINCPKTRTLISALPKVRLEEPVKHSARVWPLEPMDNIDLAPEFDCPAIRRCCQAWYSAFRAAQVANTNPVSVRMRANEAYRYAMPPLTSTENVRDFVACVVHGMMVGAIVDERGTRWLYAAQVAASAFRAMAAGSRAAARKPVKHSSTVKNRMDPLGAAVSLSDGRQVARLERLVREAHHAGGEA